ncbi:MAG: dUTP diphosphatase [Butyrivibrio sp.]|jgi:dUTP pyrophosphatase|nr:dUTP diphosphatase [Butyrivibrio sp.]
MEINVKQLTETAQLPTRGSEYAAGYDLYADIQEAIKIGPHMTAKIATGLAMEIPEGYFGAIFARSGLATKESLRPANCVGVIDADYRGPVMVALHNDAQTEREVTPGERIAQLVVMPFLPVTFHTVEELGETSRGEGGFGSTGKI